MAGAFRGEPGGIQGLLDLPTEQWEAIEADALRAGHHLEELNWREIRILAEHSRPGDSLYQLVHGERAAWSQESHRIVDLAETVDRLIWTLQAVNTPKNTPLPPPPRPRRRPGVETPETDEKVTGEPLSADLWDEFWRTGVHPNGRRDPDADAP